MSNKNPGAGLAELRAVVARLRAPGGCDWDRAQDFASMRRYLLEEAYELINAVDARDLENLREELGDLLFIVMFYAQLAEERDQFTIDDAAAECAAKLIRRHPHVFGDVKVVGVDEILSNWDRIKAQEKVDRPASADVERGQWLPALLRAEEIQKGAGKIGFDWSGVQGPLQKIAEETQELVALLDSGDDERLEEEMGDLLFSAVNLARKLKINPELALHRATRKFEQRTAEVQRLAAERSLNLKAMSEAELDQLWDEVRQRSAGISR